MITKTEIQASNAINASAKQWAIENLEYLNKPMRYLGSSLKVEKGADKFDTYIQYLQPADKVATDKKNNNQEEEPEEEPTEESDPDVALLKGIRLLRESIVLRQNVLSRGCRYSPVTMLSPMSNCGHRRP